MATIRYTPKQLEALRHSPLVKKPDGLPSIDQWIETEEQGQRKGKIARTRNDDVLGLGDRPSLLGTRHLSRNSAQEDIVLGPPKTPFGTTSTRTHKPTFSNDRISSNPLEELVAGSRTGSRGAFSRDSDRQGDRSTSTNNRRTQRDTAESWTAARSRKGTPLEDGDALPRNGHKERYGRDGDADGVDGSRRNGLARSGRHDLRSREDGDSLRSGSKQSNWRERERDRERDRDRDRGRRDEWTRGGRIEEDPEWMDTPVKSEVKQAHTQEDFQRWKERMKAGISTPADEDERALEPLPAEPQPPASSKPVTPLTLDNGGESMFGLWAGDKKRAEAGPKTAPGKAKSSRFAGFFAPQDEPTPPPPPPPEPPQPSPPPMPMQAPMPMPMAMSLPQQKNEEDKAGFQRILQMLGGASLTPQPPATAPPGATGFGPEARENINTISSPPPTQGRQSTHGAQSRRVPSVEPKSLQGFLGGPPDGSYAKKEQHERSGSRNDHNAGPQLNRDSEFLLNLMQQSRKTPQHTSYNLPAGPDSSGEAHRNYTGENDFPTNHHHELDVGPGGVGGAMPRPPPGFFDDPAISAMQRREGGENGHRPFGSNMGIPQQGLPEWILKGGIPPGDRIPPPPPPGFNPNARPPPGFGGPNGPPFPPGNGPPPPPPGMGRGIGPPPPGFNYQMPPPGFFPGPHPPPGFPPGPLPEHLLRGPTGAGAPPPGRGQFDLFAEMNQGRPMGRGGPNGPPGKFGM